MPETASHFLPSLSELFTHRKLVERHPALLTRHRVQWALRNRDINGLTSANAVFETQSGHLLIHEPAFLAWFLKLDGRNRPRAVRRIAKSNTFGAPIGTTKRVPKRNVRHAK